MGYKECLELAGATVIDYEEFGSYQGDWLAYVEYKGKKGFIKDYYGSCTGEVADVAKQCAERTATGCCAPCRVKQEIILA
jgi:hypothetical protein